MYAVIKTGGKQYRVAQGEYLRVEKLEGNEGDSIELNDVLMIADGDKLKIGTPMIDGGKVTATIKSHGRGKKVEIMKFRRRKHHQKRTGHRQSYTELEITAING
ncbi:MAG: 50S ribosomal protein L21 [Gammaproteobacteria bacterium]|nr:50S ribosomal protein L21 [Gammaproteobacteria bacterium]MCW8909739.1 50S ribosomal protein L21 [Gammaproteobacteria bacterium]MCW9003734.1 50S ribosomal protein L21 [Gammaproteobacteria bacterium]MCW9056307.1 50S ribosomal protein L21 [Gammaproteobacteria bacterium]